MTWVYVLLLLALGATQAMAHVGDRCELNSECDTGEQCHLQECVARQTMRAPLDEGTDKPPQRKPSSMVCMTGVTMCALQEPARSGTVCYCATVSGQVGGIVP